MSKLNVLWKVGFPKFPFHFWLLFLGRFLTGIAVSLLIPGAMACIIDITTEEERAKGVSFLNASISFGFAKGPGIGGSNNVWFICTFLFCSCYILYFLFPVLFSFLKH